MAKVTVLGAGAWGVALGNLLHDNGNDVTMWTFLEKEADMLKNDRENKVSLPGVKIPDGIAITTDFDKAVEDKDIIVLATASRFIRETSAKLKGKVREHQIIVNVSKGTADAAIHIYNKSHLFHTFTSAVGSVGMGSQGRKSSGSSQTPSGAPSAI